MQTKYALCLLSLLLTAGTASAEEAQSTKANDESPLLSLEKGDMIRVIFDPLYRTNLSAQVNTPVETISKRMGDSFKKGEVLIHLDDDIFQGNLLKAQAALDKAETELNAKRQLYKDNTGSFFELKEAEAAAATAQADLVVAKKNLEASTIIAPYDGKVVHIYVEEHELPPQGKELIELVDDEKVLAKMLVPSSLYNQIKLGKEITINIQETGQKIKAKISRIGAVIDPSSGTLRIEAEIDNKNGNIKPGMTGSAHF